MPSILVTGGAGFIGSHTCVSLIENGYDVVVVDDFTNSSPRALERVERITGIAPKLYEVDITGREALEDVFRQEDISAVIHFAGLKAVGESVSQPARYYRTNVCGTLTLLEVMREHGVMDLIFSSSATVYGDPEQLPLKEDFPTGAVTNPYGRTKYMVEEILKDLSAADPAWNFVVLRYFNPIGAHPSGLIGEDPAGIPNNLVPYIAQVASGVLEHVSVFGDDYDTPDGSGIRDYIHVMDLSEGHVASLRWMAGKRGFEAFNLGTGTGYSVFEVIQAFSRASERDIPFEITPRRDGDIAACYADPTKAREELGWTASRGLAKMCEDSWRWQSNNPRGYAEDPSN